MKRTCMMFLAAAVLLALPAVALAQNDQSTGDADTSTVTSNGNGLHYSKAFSFLGACLGAGVTVIGGGISISRISAHALESIARQPEAAGQMFLAWLIPAAMIEGAMLFGVTICMMVLFAK